jgi:hypothetical protein
MHADEKVAVFALRNNATSQKAVEALTASGLPWENNGRTLWGHSEGHEQFTLPNACQLPVKVAELLQEQIHRQQIDYIVWSYETPIAWHHKGNNWSMPDVEYSVTTSKHQSVARGIVNNVLTIENSR